MNEIIEMARQADCLHVNLTGDRAKAVERLEAFAKLVADKATKQEQDRCCAIVFAQCDSDNVAQRTVDAIRGQA